MKKKNEGFKKQESKSLYNLKIVIISNNEFQIRYLDIYNKINKIVIDQI